MFSQFGMDVYPRRVSPLNNGLNNEASPLGLLEAPCTLETKICIANPGLTWYVESALICLALCED